MRNAPITVQNVVTYDTVIGVSNPDLKLKPGMTANVSIVVAHRDECPERSRTPRFVFGCPIRRRRQRRSATRRQSHRDRGTSLAELAPSGRTKRTVYVLAAERKA